MLDGFRKEKYDRADMLMSAGLSTFACSALLLITPRLGILLIELLVGLFLIGCAFISRLRLNKAAGAVTRTSTGSAAALGSSARAWYGAAARASAVRADGAKRMDRPRAAKARDT